MSQPTILIDSCSYVFYRVTATASWYRKSSPEGDISLDNQEFMTNLENQFWKHLDKLVKKYGVPINQMYLIRDCPIDEIWRRRVFPEYKEKRFRASPSLYGPFIKHLNAKIGDKFKKVIRITGAEADDIIATYVMNSSNNFNGKQILVVGNDSDYHQLLAYDHVNIIRPKNWELVAKPAATLPCSVPLVTKILAGDATDGIPGCFPGCGQKTAEGLARSYSKDSQLVTYLLDMEKKTPGTYSNYLRNRELIDFTYIPSALRRTILTEFGSGEKQTEIQLGLCCLNTKLRAQNIFCSRKPILKTIATKGLPDLLARCTQNCQDLIKMIEWNYQNGIRVFRISSEIFPHYTNPKSPVKYTLDFAQDLLSQAGQLARRYGQRLTFHPGQYNVIATPNQDSWEKTKADLDMHAEILDRIGCPVDSVMVIHAGGMYGDKQATKLRWAQRFKELPERVQRRLVLENCEKCFSIIDCLEVSSLCGVPVVFDTHHYDCYIQMHPTEQFEPAEKYIPKILETWNKRGIKPKFHISEQAPGGQIGKHSELIETIPSYLLEIPEKYKVHIDIMVEAKLKEQAIFKLYTKYPVLDPRINVGVTATLPTTDPSRPKIIIKARTPSPIQKIKISKIQKIDQTA